MRIEQKEKQRKKQSIQKNHTAETPAFMARRLHHTKSVKNTHTYRTMSSKPWPQSMYARYSTQLLIFELLFSFFLSFFLFPKIKLTEVTGDLDLD
jgi:hypothetical protein